jgi:pyridinium-3,5-biscarboxylic acid mononucleotide sulfurtransferase
MNGPIEAKLDALVRYLADLSSVLVCFSGGVDSAFLLAACQRAPGLRAIGMTAVSPSLHPAELEAASAFAASIAADHRVVESQEIEVEGYQANGTDRCFYCKTELYEIAQVKRAEWNVEHILNGTNIDDLGDYRPGLEAAKQKGVKSPLVELGFNKAEVREGAKLLGLELWDKPAAACLSSRIAFGTRVTRERLARVAALESTLAELGFRGHRVRYHPAGPNGDQALARIELPAADLARAFTPEVREAILSAANKAEFLYVTVDLAGYRMGSHNAAIGHKRSLNVVQ